MGKSAKTVLLLGDITGRSRVAVRMLTAVLENSGHEVLSLPTALISNTLNLGRHQALDTTQYMLDSLETWAQLGIRWEMTSIGYVTGEEQAKALCRVAREERAQGRYVILDPILGDGGRKYLSVTHAQLQGMKTLCGAVDLVTPNLTEAALLAGVPYEQAAAGGAYDAMLARLSGEGARSVLITSGKTEAGGHAMAGYDAKRAQRFMIPYDALDVSRGGTGDLFSALLMDGLLSGRALEDAARAAGDGVRKELLKPDGGILPELKIR